jgi:hypothetical protein
VTMLYSIRGILLHLREDIAHNLGCIVGSLLRSRCLVSASDYIHQFQLGTAYVDSNITQLWPAESMVHVVFAEVVFGQVCDVCVLNVGYIGRM